MQDTPRTGSLAITRRPKEGMTITVPASDTETVVHVRSTSVKGQQTHLTIAAPLDVKILRDELIKRDEEKALNN